MRTEKNWRKT